MKEHEERERERGERAPVFSPPLFTHDKVAPSAVQKRKKEREKSLAGAGVLEKFWFGRIRNGMRTCRRRRISDKLLQSRRKSSWRNDRRARTRGSFMLRAKGQRSRGQLLSVPLGFAEASKLIPHFSAGLNEGRRGAETQDDLQVCPSAVTVTLDEDGGTRSDWMATLKPDFFY